MPGRPKEVDVQLRVGFGWSDLVIGHQPFNQLPSQTFGTFVPVAFQCSDNWPGADGTSKSRQSK